MKSATDAARQKDGPNMTTEGISPDEVLPAPTADAAGEGGKPEEEVIHDPAKVMRIGSMVKQLLEEVRLAPLDEAGRVRLREIHEQSLHELQSVLSPELTSELDRMAKPFENPAPSEAELRIAQAQLVGWLEGLFHGIQAALMAQQLAARAQLEELRRRELPPGGESTGLRGGTYL
jgi:hypothetical protein